jgi:hypothetical protein
MQTKITFLYTNGKTFTVPHVLFVECQEDDVVYTCTEPKSKICKTVEVPTDDIVSVREVSHHKFLKRDILFIYKPKCYNKLKR